VLGVFGAISVTLKVIGIFGVMAQAVGQRANEIAVRMALGAQSLNVLGLVLRQGLMLIASCLPARRALKVAPIAALRGD
jgi:putative ABC transport system permease protein